MYAICSPHPTPAPFPSIAHPTPYPSPLRGGEFLETIFTKHFKKIIIMSKLSSWKPVFKFLSMLFATLAGSALFSSCVGKIM